MKRFDVLIIGTGAGGGTLAHALAPSGKRVLLIERGGYVPREPDNWNSREVFLQRKYKPREVWYDADGNAHPTPTHYCVGGNTKFYGATLMRFRPQDFEEVIHPAGVSPAWPIRYADLEPYYTRAERLYCVHGQRGVDPSEPPGSDSYPYPRVEHEPRIQQLAEELSRLGHRPFHLPLAILLHGADQGDGRGRCIRCATCGGFPCFVNAKADAQNMCVEPALQHPNVEIVTGARALRLETDASGKTVTCVHVEQGGVHERYAADIVVVACGAVNSAALLLRSACQKHPQGLANGSGVVGRHYMRHNISLLIALSRQPNPTVFQKTLGMNEFYFGDDGWSFPMGSVQLLGRPSAEIRRAEGLDLPAGVTLTDVVERGIDFCALSEDLPDRDNRVVLDEKGEITLRWAANNLPGHERLVARLASILGKSGCEEGLLTSSMYIGGRSSVINANHQCGTVRFGSDGRTSALDENCKAHELDNLYVVDGSFFVSSAAVNPALTIMANALRVGDHLIERLR